MAKLRKKLIREKAVVSMYQHFVSQPSELERHNALKLDNELNKDRDDLNYCLEMCDDMIVHLDEITAIIEIHLKQGWHVDSIAKLDRAILTVGVYELAIKKFDKNIVINEAIELAKKYCDDNTYKYINGVLTHVI